ncbi:MAG: hypothetical protein JWP94_478 [Mucilaginibacter sp.]|nr:hypothetical protein [Mucilaginibacter sp.]
MTKSILVLAILIGMGISSASPSRRFTRLAVDPVYICISNTAHKYHNDRDCRGLAKCTHQIRKVSKDQAIKMGYKPCKICTK